MAHHDKQNPKMDEKGKQQAPNRGPQAPGQPAPNREQQTPGQQKPNREQQAPGEPQQTPRQPDRAPDPSRGERSDKDSIGQPVQLDQDRA